MISRKLSRDLKRRQSKAQEPGCEEVRVSRKKMKKRSEDSIRDQAIQFYDYLDPPWADNRKQKEKFKMCTDF